MCTGSQPINFPPTISAASLNLPQCPSRSPSSSSTEVVLYFGVTVEGKEIRLASDLAPLVAQVVKNPPTMQENQIQSLGQEEPLEKGMATHFSIHASRIPWTEEPGGLQSMGSQRVRHD